MVKPGTGYVFPGRLGEHVACPRFYTGTLNAFPLSSAAQRVGRWFLESGIQEPFGGVARYFRSDLGKNAAVSTEITGYAISTLLYLHARTGGPEYLEAALRAGRFLTRTAWDHAARTFPFEFALNGELPEPAAYFFDAGIIVRGLLALWRATGEAEFLETAGACADSMAQDFCAGGDFHPILKLPAKQPARREDRWSRDAGCYQLKSALGWYELSEELGLAACRSHYEEVLGYALRTHTAFLPGEAQPERVMDRLHAYCYFLEGLLPSTARPECAQALAEGVRRVERLRREIAPQFERSDVNAQLLRLRLFAAERAVLPLDRERARQEAETIAGFQLHEGGPRLEGGFCFGRRGGQLLPYVNPASSAFCAQALEMWRQYQAGEFEPHWRTLI